MKDNRANEERRFTLTMEAWTEVYTFLKSCTESSAPVLSRQLRDSCDLMKTRSLPGGYFDGPRAWQIVLQKLAGGKRTEMDKDFYRSAERVQRASHLPDGCPAVEYSRKALAFLGHIRPNLAQSYNDDDTATYLIGLMPKTLRGEGRRIRSELEREGKIHDFMTVISRCRDIVHEEAKAAPPTPAFVIGLDDLGTYDIAALCYTTGMELSAPAGSLTGSCCSSHGSSLTFAGAAGDGGPKWCPQCPHSKRDGSPAQCFNAPDYEGPPPPNVFCNKERWKGILAARETN